MAIRSAARIIVLAISVLCLSTVRNTEMAPVLQVSAAAPATPDESPLRLQGPQPVVTLFCQFPDVPADERLRAYYEALLGDAAPGLGDYWREVSYGQISLAGSRLAGWYPLPRTSGEYRLRPTDPATLRQLAEDCTAAAEADVFFPDYVGINLVFNYCPDTAYGGRTSLDRDGQEQVYGVTWLCPGRFSWQSEVAHEMGHALGLQHSADGSAEVYSNPWDAMSYCAFCRTQGAYGPVRPHIIAYQKDRLGWIPADRKYVAQPGSATQITLERLAQPQADNYLMAQIPLPNGSGRFYTVEARRRVGYDKNLPMDAVVIHLTDPGSNPAAVVVQHEPVEGVFVDSAWLPGMVFEDSAHSIMVEIEAATETGFVVTISTLRVP